MKLKLLFIIVASGVFSSLEAQTSKGDWMLGGSLNYYINHDIRSNPPSTDKNIYKNQGFDISPQVGKFVKKNLVVGMNLSYRRSYWTNNLESTDELIFRQKSTTASIGAFTRKYFSISEQVFLFAQADIGYFNRINSDVSSPNTEERELRTNGLQLKGYGGIAYFPKKWLAIEALISPIGYSYSVQKENEPNVESRTNIHDLNIGINTTSIFLGVNFFINKQ
ncbi:hypothetical protein [Cognataquiflexum rubidum]|uniref:hypothetical protein n=1 Tax=Cognataquiflexum rubidum TaxID=2922273 RepID=UPI001F1479D2|nr:hypothetical protein [Cognataquiflexum rubidum]MCH6234221.1 hypothetical protein [Cognataquiflexum rubidum]